LRRKGSAGGQNGIKDIINRLGTNEFPRLRVGIGRPPGGWDTADYVLGKVDSGDKPFVEKSIQDAADAVEFWVKHGITDAMNRFNADPDAKPKQKKKKVSEASVDGDVPDKRKTEEHEPN